MSKSFAVRVRIFPIVFAAILGILTGARISSAAPSWSRVDGQRIVDEKGNAIPLKSMNLGMWLVPEGYQFKFEGKYDRPTTIEALTKDLLGEKEALAFWKRWRNNFVSESDIKAMADSGFNSIRLPFHYRILSPKYGKYSEEGFGYLDRVISWAGKYNMYVILDMHCAPGGQTGTNIDDSPGSADFWDTDDNLNWASAVWGAIARRYKGNPAVMGYDLLNEPIAPQFDYDNYLLEGAYKAMAGAIRKYDTKHILFLEGAQWATNFSVFGEPMDKNMAYSFHKYWNDNNDSSISNYLKVRKDYNVPLWLGETGENNNDWYHGMISLMDKHSIGWAFWTWKKLGARNCPYTVPTPMYWEEVTAYTMGGPKPHKEHSRIAFDQLATFVKYRNCYENIDVIASLMP